MYTCNKIITHPLFNNAGAISIRVFNRKLQFSQEYVLYTSTEWDVRWLKRKMTQSRANNLSRLFFFFFSWWHCSRQMIFRTLTANDGIKKQFSILNNVDEALHSSHSFQRNDTLKKRRAVTNDWRWNETHWETEMAIANGSPLIYSLYTGESRFSFSLILLKMIGKYYSPLARQHRQMASSSDDAKSTRVWRCCGPDSGSAERSTRPIYIMLYLV